MDQERLDLDYILDPFFLLSRWVIVLGFWERSQPWLVIVMNSHIVGPNAMVEMMYSMSIDIYMIL